jgi:hypothetical protein
MTASGTDVGDPFERIRRGRVAAAARRRDRTRRRRRVALLAVLPILLLAATAGAAAVGDFTTGVPAIDGLLANERGSRPGSDLRPGPGGASEPLRLPNSADGRGAAAVAYLSRDGLVCTARGDFRRRDDAPRGTSGGGCYAPADLARILSRRTAICCGSEHGPTRRIYDGFAAGDVVAMRFLMEDGATVDARLTPPWTPDAPGAEPLRLFVAVDERDIDVGGDGVQMDEIELITGPRYRIEADLSDGRTVEVDTPGSG